MVIERALNIIDNGLKITHCSPLQKAGFYDIHKSSSRIPDITLDALPMPMDIYATSKCVSNDFQLGSQIFPVCHTLCMYLRLTLVDLPPLL